MLNRVELDLCPAGLSDRAVALGPVGAAGRRPGVGRDPLAGDLLRLLVRLLDPFAVLYAHGCLSSDVVVSRCHGLFSRAAVRLPTALSCPSSEPFTYTVVRIDFFGRRDFSEKARFGGRGEPLAGCADYEGALVVRPGSKIAREGRSEGEAAIKMGAGPRRAEAPSTPRPAQSGKTRKAWLALMVVPGILAERAELDAAGDRLTFGVADVLAMAVDNQRRTVRRPADRTDPDDDVADLAASVPDIDQVAGAEHLEPVLVGGRQLHGLEPRPALSGTRAVRSSAWICTSVLSRTPKPRLSTNPVRLLQSTPLPLAPVHVSFQAQPGGGLQSGMWWCWYPYPRNRSATATTRCLFRSAGHCSTPGGGG